MVFILSLASFMAPISTILIVSLAFSIPLAVTASSSYLGEANIFAAGFQDFTTPDPPASFAAAFMAYEFFKSKKSNENEKSENTNQESKGMHICRLFY
jgi:hypothetical protein